MNERLGFSGWLQAADANCFLDPGVAAAAVVSLSLSLALSKSYTRPRRRGGREQQQPGAISFGAMPLDGSSIPDPCNRATTVEPSWASIQGKGQGEAS